MGSREEKHRIVAESSRVHARLYMNRGNVARAFSHFLVAIQLEPECFQHVGQDFVYCLRELGLELESTKNYQQLFSCYERSLAVFPKSCEIQNNFGAHLFRLEKIEEAAVYFMKALKLNPDYLPAKDNLDSALNALVERWHFPMLNDFRRNLAYRSAIRRAVQKGHRKILDIGSGTGLLSMFAAEAGATDIYACEMSEVMHALSKDVLEANNFQDRIKLFKLHSGDLLVPDQMPERVSLVITETLDCGLLGEHILSSLNHAWDNLLQQKENLTLQSMVIPSRAIVKACLVECESIRIQNKITVTQLPEIGLKLPEQMSIEDEDPYLAERLEFLPSGIKFLTKPAEILCFDFNNPYGIKNYLHGHESNIETSVCESGHADAIVSWFELHLDETEIISTAGGTCWEQAVYPTDPLINGKVTKNDNVRFDIKVTDNCIHLKYIDDGNAIGHSALSSKTQSKCSRPDLMKLNDESYWTFMVNCLKHVSCNQKHVLDSSAIPISALIALKLGAADVYITQQSNTNVILEIAGYNNLNVNKIHILENAVTDTSSWDIIISDIIESNGLLKQGFLEDNIFRCLSLKSTGNVIPNSITLHAVIIESRTINEMTRLIDNNRVGNFNIADTINIFKTSIHCDIIMAMVPHRKLTSPVQLLEIPLSKANPELNEIHTEIEVKVIENGEAHGMFFWYKFTMDEEDDLFFDTSNTKSHWKQCCFVLAQPFYVTKSQKLSIHVEWRNSAFNFKIAESL